MNSKKISTKKVHTQAYLEAYKNQRRTSNDEVRNYLREYAALSERVNGIGDLSEYDQCPWFTQGLSVRTCLRVIEKGSLYLKRPRAMKFQLARQIVADTVRTSMVNDEVMEKGQEFRGFREMAYEYGKANTRGAAPRGEDFTGPTR